MRFRSLGDSGLLVSVAGLGCNNFGSRLDVQQTRAVVDAVRRGQAPPPGSRLASREGYITEPKLDRVEALARWAAEQGVSLLDVAIGGLAAQPGCASVIAGATSPEQANAAAADWIPSQDALTGLDQIVPAPDPGA